MEPVPSGSCPNCGQELLGKFCYQCGQKRIEDKERTLKHFFGEFIHASFHVEHNILGNFWRLLTRPGFIAKEYIEGRRKRHMSPFTVFAVINILYFLFSPLTDLSLRLPDQKHQFYGALAQSMIESRLENRQITAEEYAVAYDARSDSLSKIMVIINVPLFALFIALMYRRSKKFFFADHLIFALTYFGFFLLSALLLKGPLHLAAWLRIPWAWQAFQTCYLVGALVYMLLALRRVYRDRWVMTVLKLLFLVFGFVVTHFIYRFILFLITFLAT